MAKSKTIKMDIGTIYKKTPQGNYYYRFQIKDKRKAVCLKTKKKDEAIAEAKKLMPVVTSTSVEVISAHVKYARGLAKKLKPLNLCEVWDIYSEHHERSTPTTVHEQESYKSTLLEFIKFLKGDNMDIREVTPELTSKFANYLRKQEIAVDTHNRKIRRLKKIFEVLHEYRDSDNPFLPKSLRRKVREEQDNSIRRISFTRDEEKKILKVLDDDKYKVKNKPEIKVIYYIAMFTGQRFKDCIMLRWDQVDLNRKRIWVKQFKTGKDVTIPIASQLLDVLPEAQEWKENQYVCPNVAERYNKQDKNGRNTGNNLVNIDALRVIKWIGLEPSVKVPGRKKKVTVYGFHSLRHSFVSHCAEAGVPKAVVISIIGTNSKIVDKHYTHIGDEAQEKLISQVFGDRDSCSDHDKIKQVLDIIDNLTKKGKIILDIEKILR